jgi:hypothetical protein
MGLNDSTACAAVDWAGSSVGLELATAVDWAGSSVGLELATAVDWAGSSAGLALATAVADKSRSSNSEGAGAAIHCDVDRAA